MVSFSIILVQVPLSLLIRKFQIPRLALPLFDLVPLDGVWVMDSRIGNSKYYRSRVDKWGLFVGAWKSCWIFCVMGLKCYYWIFVQFSTFECVRLCTEYREVYIYHSHNVWTMNMYIEILFWRIRKRITPFLLFFSLNLNLLSWVLRTIKAVEFWFCLFFWVLIVFLSMFCFCKF